MPGGPRVSAALGTDTRDDREEIGHSEGDDHFKV
jgi:hypothetical protein